MHDCLFMVSSMLSMKYKLLNIFTMSRTCELTNKRTIFGGARKHKRGSSGGGGVWQFKAQRTARTWKLNLKKVLFPLNRTILGNI